VGHREGIQRVGDMSLFRLSRHREGIQMGQMGLYEVLVKHRDGIKRIADESL